MDKQAKLEYQQKVEKYLTDNRVYDLFEELLKSLIVKQPDNPISFMIDKLSETPSSQYLTQPKRFSLLVRLASKYESWRYMWQTIISSPLSLSAICCARRFQKNWVMSQINLARGEEIESYFKAFTFVRDDIVVQIVKQEL